MTSSIVAPSVCPDNAFIGNADGNGDGGGDVTAVVMVMAMIIPMCLILLILMRTMILTESGFGSYVKSTKPQNLSLLYREVEILCWAFFHCNILHAHHDQMISLALQHGVAVEGSVSRHIKR